MRRLFIAAVPGDNLLQRLLAMQQALAERALSLKLTRESHLHLTLRFIGDCDEAQAGRIAAWLGALSLPEVDGDACVLTGVDAFPGRDGLLVYAAVRAFRGFAALQAEVEQGLRGLGLKAETRPFVPHITLARKVKLRQALEGLDTGRELRFAPPELALFESRLTGEGPVYSPLLTRPLITHQQG